jgi:peptidoglycan/xylan/chitin deacetylase (PgdA/CDA1 family)
VSEDEIRDELTRTNEIVRAVTSQMPALMRPPVGRLDERVTRIAAEVGFRYNVLWSLNSDDWRRAEVSVEDIVHNVCSRASPGTIVLLHDGPPPERPDESCDATVDALGGILSRLSEDGYRFVTVSDLLAMA